MQIYLVLLCNDLSMGIRGWEPIHILFYLVSKYMRLLTEKRLSTHDLHWHNCVQLALKLFFWAIIGHVEFSSQHIDLVLDAPWFIFDQFCA